jgi:hypothetical protein
MDNHVRTILVNLVRTYGESLASDPLRTEGLLRDSCQKNHREIFVLVNAVRQRVPADLCAPRHSLPFPLLKGFLKKRLRDELSFSDEAAHWAVESWAEALGLSEGSPGLDTGTIPLQQEIQKPARPDDDPSLAAQRQQWADDLESASLATRIDAVNSLAHSKDPESIRLLISALENGNWQVRFLAFDALSDMGECAVPLLIEALGDSSNEIVWRAVLICGSLKAPGAVMTLISLLERKGAACECSLWALGEIGDPRASTALLKFLYATDLVLVHEAETALLKIGDKKVKKD